MDMAAMGGAFNSSAAPGLAEPVDLDNPLPKHAIGRVIGRGGATIKALQSSSGCRIHIDKETRKLSISGEEKQVQKARSLIEELLMGKSQTVHKHADYGMQSMDAYMNYMQPMMMVSISMMLMLRSSPIASTFSCKRVTGTIIITNMHVVLLYV